jgi:phosphoheptose isomerase
MLASIGAAFSNIWGIFALFPDRTFSDVGDYLDAYSKAVTEAFAALDKDELRRAAAVLESAVSRKAAIFVCGNGGSASISNHFACDHLKGIRTGTSVLPRVFSLSTNIEIVTAVANDIGYANIFDFQLASLASERDVLVAISSSGASPNIIAALRWAREHGMTSIAMTGFSGGEGRKLADIALHVDAHNYGVVEDIHQSIMHLLAQFLRHKKLIDVSQIGQIKF